MRSGYGEAQPDAAPPANPVQVVDPDVDDARCVWSHIHEHQWDFAETKMVEQGIFHAKGENRKLHRRGVRSCAARKIPCASDRVWLKSAGCRNYFDRKIFKGLNNLREKGIGDFRYDEAKNATSPGNQSASLRVWVISELFYDLPSTFGQLRIDGRDTIDRPVVSRTTLAPTCGPDAGRWVANVCSLYHQEERQVKYDGERPA